MATPKLDPIPIPPPGDLTGARIGRFEVLRRIGAGGMGEVYLAEDSTLKRAVALKRVHPRLRSEWAHLQRLLKEAEKVSALNHPNIAAIYDVLQDRGEVILVMEMVDGVPLRSKLGAPVESDEAVRIAMACAEALRAAHEKGIIHGDIKPENIMLTPSGGVKLLDFGVARRMNASHETVESVSASDAKYLGGTPSYMAPETLLNEEPDERSDLFSLGIVMYEMLAGRHPFPAESVLQRSDKIVHETPTSLRTVDRRIPASVDHVVFRLLEKDRGKRYPSAAEVLDDLRRIASGGGMRALLAGRLVRAVTGPERVTWIMVVLLATAMVSSLFVRERGNPELPAGDRRFVAVLPFRVIGDNPDDRAFAQGLAATLSARLTQFSTSQNLQVAPTEEIHRSDIVSVGDARKKLGANLVIEGNIHRAGNSIRVSAILVDTSTQRQLRAETITADVSDPFGLEDRVAQASFRMLQLEMTEAALKRTPAPAVSASAREEFLRGYGYVQTMKAGDVQPAIEAFQRSLAPDPKYAPSLAGLGYAYWRKYETTSQPQWIGLAKENCSRAVQADPALPLGHVCAGNIAYGTGDYENAVSEYQRVLKQDRTEEAAYRGLGKAYQRLNQTQKAEETYRRAIEVRPQYWVPYAMLAGFYSDFGRYQDAITQLRRASELVPDNYWPKVQLSANYYQLGQYQDAIQVLQPLAGAQNDRVLSQLALNYFASGKYETAVSLFEKSVAARGDFANTGSLARAQYWAGDKDKALVTYRRAIALCEEQLQVNPRNPDVHILMADYFAKVGQKKDALTHLRRALALQPTLPEYRFWAASVQVQLKDKDAALKSLEQAANGHYSISEIRSAPEFQELRSEPRFQAIVTNR